MSNDISNNGNGNRFTAMFVKVLPFIFTIMVTFTLIVIYITTIQARAESALTLEQAQERFVTKEVLELTISKTSISIQNIEKQMNHIKENTSKLATQESLDEVNRRVTRIESKMDRQNNDK